MEVGEENLSDIIKVMKMCEFSLVPVKMEAKRAGTQYIPQTRLDLSYYGDIERFMYSGADWSHHRFFAPGETQWYLRSLLQDAWYAVNCRSAQDLADEIILPEGVSAAKTWERIVDLDDRLNRLFGSELYQRLLYADWDR